MSFHFFSQMKTFLTSKIEIFFNTLIKSFHYSVCIKFRINSHSLLITGPRLLVTSQIFIYLIFSWNKANLFTMSSTYFTHSSPQTLWTQRNTTICVHYLFTLSLAHTSWNSCNFLVMGILGEDPISVFCLLSCTRDLVSASYIWRQKSKYNV